MKNNWIPDQPRLTAEEYYKGILFSAYLVGQSAQRSIQNEENGRSFTDWYNENPSIQYQSFASQEVEAALKDNQNLRGMYESQLDYGVALQRAIEFHCKNEYVPMEVFTECPHHSKMLNQNLTENEDLKIAFDNGKLQGEMDQGEWALQQVEKKDTEWREKIEKAIKETNNNMVLRIYKEPIIEKLQNLLK